LIAIYLRLNIGREAVSARDRWLIHAPFSIYLGWISVATVANATQLLYYLNWGGWGIAPEVWAVIMLIIAAALPLIDNLARGDVVYSLVFVWAYIGIAVKHADTPAVMLPAAILAAVIALMLVARKPVLQLAKVPVRR